VGADRAAAARNFGDYADIFGQTENGFADAAGNIGFEIFFAVAGQIGIDAAAEFPILRETGAIILSVKVYAMGAEPVLGGGG
jgi:hypothetical protein